MKSLKNNSPPIEGYDGTEVAGKQILLLCERLEGRYEPRQPDQIGE